MDACFRAFFFACFHDLKKRKKTFYFLQFVLVPTYLGFQKTLIHETMKTRVECVIGLGHVSIRDKSSTVTIRIPETSRIRTFQELRWHPPIKTWLDCPVFKPHSQTRQFCPVFKCSWTKWRPFGFYLQKPDKIVRFLNGKILNGLPWRMLNFCRNLGPMSFKIIFRTNLGSMSFKIIFMTSRAYVGRAYFTPPMWQISDFGR